MDLGQIMERILDFEAERDNGTVDLAAAVKLGADMRRSSELLLGSSIYVWRKAGTSWADIGKELGMSRQAAWERFHEYEDLSPEFFDSDELGDDSVSFPFSVNGSFIDYLPHPITIPKRAHDKLADTIGTATRDVVVFGSDGEEMPGRIRHSVSGGGPYFQLGINEGTAGETVCDFQIGQRISVEIVTAPEVIVYLSGPAEVEARGTTAGVGSVLM